MILIKEIFSGKVKTHAAIFFASFLFLLIFSTSTSPLYDSWGDDSAIFQAVGRGWAEGLLPYVDLFENKGPLIFLIDAIGYSIAPRVGIFLLQIPAMYLSFLLAWRSLGIFLSGKMKLAAAIFMFMHYAIYTLDGNRTEEWSMPFLMAATYFFLRGLKAEKFSCPPLYGFIYGLGFGTCVLLRTTNAAPLCLCAFLSAVFLIQAGEFKTLLKNLLNFCAGAVIVVLPFVIYFAAHGALYDALYGTILLNLNYTANASSYPLNEIYFWYVVTNFFPLILLLLSSFLALIKQRNNLTVSGFFIGVAMLIFMIKLRPYIGYCVLIIPTIPFLFIIADRIIEIYSAPFKKLIQKRGFSLKRLTINFLIACLAMIGVLWLYIYGHIFYGTLKNIFVEEYFAKREPIEFLQLKESIPEDERNSFVTWGRSGFISHWILITGMKSREKFFGYIKSFGDVDPSIRKNWFKNINDNPPQWILYCWKVNELFKRDKDTVEFKFLSNKDEELEKILQEKYHLKDMRRVSRQIMKLYRLKD
ncbi:MAG: hypothetical protein SR3Q1_10950 [Quinella sp. 3Q1]|nr:hypothetical protein [Quinella sp. 3Q1]